MENNLGWVEKIQVGGIQNIYFAYFRKTSPEHKWKLQNSHVFSPVEKHYKHLTWLNGLTLPHCL